MFSFMFWFPENTYKPGFVERIFVEGPFYKAQRHPQTGQMVPLRDQQGNLIPDIQAAGRWVASLGFPYPSTKSSGNIHGVSFAPEGQPKILAVQKTMPAEPSLSGAHVVAAQQHGMPVGNRGHGVTQPPSVPVRAPQTLQPRDPVDASTYDELDPSALPVAADSMFDADAQGGTFTDISPATGHEEIRKLEPRPYDPTKVR